MLDDWNKVWDLSEKGRKENGEEEENKREPKNNGMAKKSPFFHSYSFMQ